MADKQFSISEADLKKMHKAVHELFKFIILNEPCCNWPPARERERRQGLIESALAEIGVTIFSIDHEYTWDLHKELANQDGKQKVHHLKLIQNEKEIPSNEG
jgi:hypothetical protein